ncbi:Rsd/AlgQ family anti-sigma factor [Pseudoalteromonas sp. NBT06-2]|uniref:sigma D regulator n=1 Tax=Pseudoalteromonas sp. NBT06-2 TaxID=2025950 RepID=UPI000BA649DC|nr:sigma D regulator [Pseudoalteromonas sp. NBT06-2]PAJ73055.1 Rsd/AlgQ family anti-sigma factor [Pseudoalteromonas sp. NBT06-2]
MLTQLEKAQQEWGGSHSVIDSWLDERQELLVLYCKLVGLPPFDSKEQALPELDHIQKFCQILMDYLSAGHFEIYNDIAKACETKGKQSLALAQVLYPKISESTDVALSFNDKYAEIKQESLLPDFDAELSKLGEILEQRFEYEDKLIDNLYSNH